MFMEQKLWRLCCDIIDYAYKNIDENKKKRYKYVFFEVSNRELATFHGDYSPKNKKIRIFNLSRDDKSVLCTSLHELAHHIDYINRGTTDHSQEFYKVYEQLIKAALEMNLTTKEQLLSLKRDASDTNKVKKIVEDLKVGIVDTYKKNKYIIRVMNCFNIKEHLKVLGYNWNGTSRVWEKEVNKEELELEKKKVEELISSENIEIRFANEITFDCFSYLIVLDSFKYKEQLKERGYYYDGKKRSWKKRFNNKEIKNEISYLKQIGLNKVSIQK